MVKVGREGGARPRFCAARAAVLGSYCFYWGECSFLCFSFFAIRRGSAGNCLAALVLHGPDRATHKPWDGRKAAGRALGAFVSIGKERKHRKSPDRAPRGKPTDEPAPSAGRRTGRRPQSTHAETKGHGRGPGRARAEPRRHRTETKQSCARLARERGRGGKAAGEGAARRKATNSGAAPHLRGGYDYTAMCQSSCFESIKALLPRARPYRTQRSGNQS